MAQVILGGLLSSTFLNLVLVPVLFARWGGAAAPEAGPEAAGDPEIGEILLVASRPAV